MFRVRAGGIDDPEGREAAAVVGAYFHAEQARTARRQLSRVFAVPALATWALYRLTPILTAVDLAVVLALLGGAVTVLAVAEWRAKKQLVDLLASTRT